MEELRYIPFIMGNAGIYISNRKSDQPLIPGPSTLKKRHPKLINVKGRHPFPHAENPEKNGKKKNLDSTAQCQRKETGCKPCLSLKP